MGDCRKVKKISWKKKDLSIFFEDNSKENFQDAAILSVNGAEYYDNGKTMFIKEIVLTKNRIIKDIYITNRQANVLDRSQAE